MNLCHTSCFLQAVFFATLIHCSVSHGLLTEPPQRGTLNPANKFNDNGIWTDAPIDGKPHFPAGNKSAVPLAAVRSQKAAVPFWTPFEPTKHDFQWRAGVCGDQIAPFQPHMRGKSNIADGEFYYGGLVTRNYTQGSIIDLEVNILANHNGFMEIHMCDVQECGGEISEDCFKQGHCYHLLRAATPSCESGNDRGCAPIDPNYPHRWHMPCSTVPENTQERFGRDKMQFKLPQNLTCDHCVLHWFWTAALNCNPPGVKEFFEGPNAPNWGDCSVQGGRAPEGYRKYKETCGGPDLFPEEYYQCADVRIVPDGERREIPTPSPSSSNSPKATSTPTPSCATARHEPTATSSPVSGSIVQGFSLIADGKVIGHLADNAKVDIGSYSKIAIEVLTTRSVGQMRFYIDDKLEWTEYTAPYFLYGNEGRIPNYWPHPIVNRYFSLRVEAEGYVMQAKLMFLQ